MANTYTQIHIQAVFAVQNRKCIIAESWEEDLYKYIAGVLNKHNHKVLAINGMPDHIHILFGFRPTQSLSELMQDIKGSSSKWINQNRKVQGKFSWQEGYGAFSYSKWDVEKINNYVRNQKIHHKQKYFSEEYHTLLDDFDVPFDERYIFKPILF